MKTPQWLSRAFKAADNVLFRIELAQRAIGGDKYAADALYEETPRAVFQAQEERRRRPHQKRA